MKILLLDWGIGGLSVYNELASSGASFVYVSDSGYTPYGKVPARELETRLRKLVTGAQKEWGIDQAVIACNAASTVLPGEAPWPIPVRGVIEPGLRLVRQSGCRKIGVIGGVRTIESRIFSSRLPDFEVREEIAQPLSALVERGILSGPELHEALAKILRPLAGVEALLLACTHYPAVKNEIARLLPGVKLLDPAKAVEVPAGGTGGETLFFTSGDPRAMEEAGLKAFGVKLHARPLPKGMA